MRRLEVEERVAAVLYHLPPWPQQERSEERRYGCPLVFPLSIIISLVFPLCHFLSAMKT